MIPDSKEMRGLHRNLSILLSRTSLGSRSNSKTGTYWVLSWTCSKTLACVLYVWEVVSQFDTTLDVFTEVNRSPIINCIYEHWVRLYKWILCWNQIRAWISFHWSLSADCYDYAYSVLKLLKRKVIHIFHWYYRFCWIVWNLCVTEQFVDPNYL